MDVLMCSGLLYGEKSCHLKKKSVMEFNNNDETNCTDHTKKLPLQETEVHHVLPSLKAVMDTMQCDGEERDREVLTLEGCSNGSSLYGVDVNDQKTEGLFDEEQIQSEEACLNFQNSHVDVNTIDSEPLCENKEEELSISASKWPEQGESLALWVKWRGKWQAGIKCERADWPLATVKAKPTHDRKSYIAIFFPHKRNYSWVDTLLVCSIDEFPQPIAHRSYKAGVQLVEDLTVARRFIMKKLVIGMLNIVDQLPIQVLAETARDVAVWREFATEASRCKAYPDLGRLLLKLQNMLLEQYIDANWLQHSLRSWVEKGLNALSADSIELLKEELVDSILWNEVNSLRDAQGQPALGSEWKTWKHEVLKCFSTAHSVSGGGDAEQTSKNSIEQLSGDTPLMTSSPQVGRKRPKLEVRRAETYNSPQKNIIVEIDSSFFSSQHNGIVDKGLVASKDELTSLGTVQAMSPGNAMDRWDEVVVETSTTEPVEEEKDGSSQHVNGVVETKSSASKTKGRQCVTFIEAKGRQCVRWANDGDEYCCVHLTSRFAANSVKAEVTPPPEGSMCQGTTTLGSRCKHRSLPGSSFCKKHRPCSDVIKSPPGRQLKRKHDQLSDRSELTSKEIVIFEEAQRPLQEHSLTVIGETTCNGGNNSLRTLEQSVEESNTSSETAFCVGLGLQKGDANCLDSPKRHSLYCDKHIPSWLKRARNGKSRIISKEVFLDLLKACSSQKQRIHLHQACELFYKLLKSILSLRNQVPKEIQFQWALSEASKDLHVAEHLRNLVSREKDRLLRIWGFSLTNDEKGSSSHAVEQAQMLVEEKTDTVGSLKCTICSEEFADDQTLGTHWIDNHNKEAQWLFRGYACAICLDSFTNRKVLETHVQERHHAQFVEHCMLIQCIPCGSHFGNSEELWSHVLSVHTERFRQSKTGENCHLSVASQQKPVPLKPPSIENNSGSHKSVRKFICRFCGLKFDLLPDLGRHHQAAHMGPSLLSSRPKKKGLRFYAYRLKSGRLSRPRLKKGLGGASYRLRNKGTMILKKRLQTDTPLGAAGINVQSHLMDASSLARLTEAQCSAIAKMLCAEARKTRPRPNNNEIISFARFACCKVDLQKCLEEAYGPLPERLYLKAAKLCSDHNIQVDWHQEGFNCPRGCKPPEDQNLVAVLTLTSECGMIDTPPENPEQECEMDECHYVVDPRQFRRKHLQTTIILCDDISFGQEKIAVPCVVDKHLLDSLHNPTYGFDGKVIFMPWESFTYVIKPLLGPSLDVDLQNLQLGCSCTQSKCCPETCDHVYLFNSDYENAMDIDGKPMGGRSPYDEEGRLILEDDYLVYECNHLCKCSSDCPNRVLQNGVRVKLEVFKTENKGWAVRACETILRGTFVCEFVGEVLDQQEANRRQSRCGQEGCGYIYDVSAHLQHMSDLMDGQVRYFIDATKYGNISRLINHSCSPNLVGHLVLVESMDLQLAHLGFYAKRDITIGEELSFDYCYELQPGEGCPCLCGATNCRGRLH